MNGSRARRARERLVLAIVALLLSGSMLTVAAHRLVVPHEVCEVHGRLEHVSPELADAAGHGEHGHGEHGRGADEGPALVPEEAPHVACELGPLIHTEGPALVVRQVGDRMPWPPRGLERVVIEVPPCGPRHALAPSRDPPA